MFGDSRKMFHNLTKKRIGCIILLICLVTLDSLYLLLNSSNDQFTEKKLQNIYIPNDFDGEMENFILDGSSISTSDNLGETLLSDQKVNKNLLNYDILSSTQEKIEVLIHFEDKTSMEQRELILNQFQEEIKIIYNYGVISASLIEIKTQNILNFINFINGYPNILSIKRNEDLDISQYINPVENSHLYQLGEEDNNYFENWWLSSIGADNLEFSGKDINIAIIDTGITVHPDFFSDENLENSRILKFEDFTRTDNDSDKYLFDSNGHGTHCAGIAAGNGYNSQGEYRGVAPEANLFSAKISNSTGFINEADTIAAIDWCVNEQADILSMSFGGFFPEVWNLESLAIQNAVEQGIVAVSSAGNSGSSLYTSGSPASGLYSIAVGASDKNNDIASFSSRGPSFTSQLLPDISAPGVNIISTESEGSLMSVENKFIGGTIEGNDDFDYISLSGTSMACPMVAGAIGLLLEAYPEATPETIRIALIQGATQIIQNGNAGYGDGQGAGILNVSASLNYLREIEENKTSINQVTMLFPREVPYSPFDLLKFPGNSQQLNLTLFSGQSEEVTIQLPELPGIEIELNDRSYSFESSGLISIPIKFSILYNSTIGTKNGFIQVISNENGIILDEIPIKISVAFPKSEIFVDTYHSFTDSVQFMNYNYANYEMYHAIYDLYENNYSVDLNMEQWNQGYNATKDAEILNIPLLSKYDTVILQAPIIPYTELEIDALTWFYNQGGSILLMGTISEHIALDSVHSLFQSLNSSIKITNSLIDFTDYAQYAVLNPIAISSFTNESILFDNVNKFQYRTGCTFSGDQDTQSLATYNGLNVVIEQKKSTESQGKLLAFGDSSIFLDNNYLAPLWYENHANLWKNTISYLSNRYTSDKTYYIESSMNQRTETLDSLNVSYYIYNLKEDSLENSINLNQNLDIQLKYPDGSKQNITSMVDFTQNNIKLDMELNATHNLLPFQLILTAYYDDEILSNSLSFYHFSNQSLLYEKISLDNDFINIEDDNPYQITFHDIIGVEHSQIPSLTVYNPSFLTERSVTSLDSNSSDSSGIIIDDTNGILDISPDDIPTVGVLVIIGNINYSLNPNLSLDLRPRRFFFDLLKPSSFINSQDSLFGETRFSDTQSDEGFTPIEINLDQSYDILISIDESLVIEENINELAVTAGLFPILIYDGSINFLNPDEIPRYDFGYEFSRNGFFLAITLPSILNYTGTNGDVSKSTQTDGSSFFLIFWLSVRNIDGLRDDFIIILTPYEETPRMFNFTPTLMTLGIIGLGIVGFNFRTKQKKKKQVTL